MAVERVNITELTGLSRDELSNRSRPAIDAALDAAANGAAEQELPEGFFFVAYFIVDDHPDRGYGVLPISTGWVDQQDDRIPAHKDRPWALTTMAVALARSLTDDDARRQFIVGLLDLASSLTMKWWGYALAVGDLEDRVTRPRPRTSRTERPSGRGGRSPKRRKR